MDIKQSNKFLLLKQKKLKQKKELQQAGIILPISLVLIAIMALLLGSSLKMANLSTQSIAHQVSRAQVFQTVDAALINRETVLADKTMTVKQEQELEPDLERLVNLVADLVDSTSAPIPGVDGLVSSFQLMLTSSAALPVIRGDLCEGTSSCVFGGPDWSSSAFWLQGGPVLDMNYTTQVKDAPSYVIEELAYVHDISADERQRVFEDLKSQLDDLENMLSAVDGLKVVLIPAINAALTSLGVALGATVVGLAFEPIIAGLIASNTACLSLPSCSLNTLAAPIKFSILTGVVSFMAVGVGGWSSYRITTKAISQEDNASIVRSNFMARQEAIPAFSTGMDLVNILPGLSAVMPDQAYTADSFTQGRQSWTQLR